MQVKRSQIILIALSGFPLLLGSGFALLVLDSSIIGDLLGTAQSYSVLELVIQALLSTALGTLIVLAMFYSMQRRGNTAKKMMIAFVVSPILYFVFLFLGEAFLLILFKGSTGVFQGIISMLSLGIAMISLAMILMDAIPNSLKNLFVAFYGSIFGIFLGIIMVSSTMFVLLVSLIAEDFLLTRFSPVAQEVSMTGRVGEDPFDYSRIKSESASVGVGDYIAFSLLSAHAVAYFPFHVWVMSLVLALVGICINVLVVAREGKLLPGIPIPALLGIIPWIVHLAALAMLGA
ncbi:MAG: hypothetical protein KAQ65_01915 [Candidatus Thorarchaeota archaeon]|nr:hypothetical protein [Candidatus Thorarchaeota archaeon]